MKNIRTGTAIRLQKNQYYRRSDVRRAVHRPAERNSIDGPFQFRISNFRNERQPAREHDRTPRTQKH